MNNIDEILEQMEELLDKSALMPFSQNKMIIDSERLRELIDDIRLNIPQEIKRAKLIDFDCERIRKEAEQKARTEKERQEVLIKQNELELKEFQTDVEANHKARELEIKERELAIRKSELLMKKIEVAASIGIPVTGAVLYQKNFDKVYKFETETIQTVMAPKAAQYMRLMEKTLTNGVTSIFRR